MAKRYAWPRCTVFGCRHQRTWDTEDEARSAADRHYASWVKPDGHATCICHGVKGATFYCDESLKVVHSA